MRKELDEIDRKIIRALQGNARLSNKELAAKVHLSPSSCLERARRLKDTGVLESFHAAIDPSSIGVGLQAIISVKMRRHTQESLEAFRQHALALEEVRALYHVTGGKDFIIHVAVVDADHLRALIVDEFSGTAELDHLETSLILEETQRPLPILVGREEAGSVRSTESRPRPLAFRSSRSRAGGVG